MNEILRILLVDESGRQARRIQDLVTGSAGVECLLSGGLEEASERLLADGSDVLVVSWPVSGDPAAREADLRRLAQLRPVILLLEAEDGEALSVALTSGVQDCLVSSELTPARLMRTVQLALGRHRELHALQSSEARYRQLFERNLTGVYRCTADGRIVDANLALARMLGFESSEELKKHSALEFYFDPAERTRALERLRSLTTVTNGELRLRRRDGSAVWVLESMSLPERDGDSGLIEGTLIDITDRKELEQALAQEQHLLHTLMEHLPDSIYFKDTESRFLRISRACARKFGCDHPDKAMGKTDFDYFAPDHAAEAFADEQEMMRNGRGMIAREEREVWPDGRVGWASTTKMPMCDAAGRIVGTFGVSRDITRIKNDQRRIEQLQRQNELILYSVGEGICGVDQAGRIMFANPTAAQLTGWTREELIGRPLHDLVHPRGGFACARNSCTLHYALQDRDKHQQEEVFFRRDGSSFPVEFISNAINDGDGQPAGAVLAFRDISERREIERMKDEFVSVVSHELRTPLTSIRGALGLLVSGRLGELPERGQRMLEIAASNTDRLVRLINDILDLERIESGKIRMEFGVHDLAQLVRQSIDLIRPMAERAGVELRGDCPPLMAWIDPDRIQQTLGNLLSNAVKFSPAGTTVEVDAGEDEDGVHIRVRDQGRGIPAEHLEKIFERFHQVDKSDSRDKGGTGLGLPICRRIIEQHGGRIWAESRMGEGSTFHILFTRSQGQAITEPPPAPETSSLPATAPDPPVMLVYGEDRNRREMVASQMMRAGYRVRVAASTDELAQQTERERPGAILMDSPPAGQGGWSSVVAVRDQIGWNDVPILVLGLAPSPALQDPLLPMITLRPSGFAGELPPLGPSPAASRHVRRILLVEDDLDLASVLMAMFQQHRVETLQASSGREAVEAARSWLPDLVVLDVGLPEGDGFHVVRGLRETKELRQVPLVVYSGRHLDAVEKQQLRLGPTEFLTKGQIAPEEFEHHVLKLLAHFMV